MFGSVVFSGVKLRLAQKAWGKTSKNIHYIITKKELRNKSNAAVQGGNSENI